MYVNRGVAILMEMYSHNLFRRGFWGQRRTRLGSGQSPGRGARAKLPPGYHELYNRIGDVFDHFESVFNYMIFCPFFGNTTTD